MDIALDDIIKHNNPRGRGGFRGGRGRGSRDNRTSGGALRRNRTTTRSAPYRSARPDTSKWAHDRYDEEEGGDDFEIAEEFGVVSNPGPGIQTGTKLLISNLDFNVSDDDIKDLFQSVGDVKKAAIKYDKSGRSIGTATVVYTRKQDAITALKKYNGVGLDGKPMKIVLVGTNVPSVGTFNDNDSSARILRSAVNEANFTVSVGGLQTRRVISEGGPRSRRLITVGRSTGGFGGGRRVGGRGGAGGRGRGRGRGRGGRQVGKVPSREELDNDLDAYSQMNDNE